MPSVLVLLAVPFDLHDALLVYPNVLLFHLGSALIGAVQGYIGATVWKGKIYTVVDGETIPGVLGVGHATLAGSLGSWLLFSLFSNCVFFRTYFLSKKKSSHGPARLLSTEPGEVEKGRW